MWPSQRSRFSKWKPCIYRSVWLSLLHRLSRSRTDWSIWFDLFHLIRLLSFFCILTAHPDWLAQFTTWPSQFAHPHSCLSCQCQLVAPEITYSSFGLVVYTRPPSDLKGLSSRFCIDHDFPGSVHPCVTVDNQRDSSTRLRDSVEQAAAHSQLVSLCIRKTNYHCFTISRTLGLHRGVCSASLLNNQMRGK